MNKLNRDWMIESIKERYSYRFSWMGLPVIQYPQDLIAMQEIIWQVKPDLIIETGIAHGGSLVFYASMLEMIGGEGEIIGIEIDLKDDNRRKIDRHPLRRRISIVDASSVDNRFVEIIAKRAKRSRRVLVALDSNHAYEHVLREMELYSPMVTAGSYMVVFDTVIEEMPDELWSEREWKKGRSPMTAVDEFLETRYGAWEVDPIHEKLGITANPRGFLKRVF